MPVDHIAIRTGILKGVEYLARRRTSTDAPEPHALYDVVQDLVLTNVLHENAPSPALRNEREAQALQNLGRSLDRVEEAVGRSLYDVPQDYLDHPLWSGVVKSARAALAQMTDGTMEWWRYRDPNEG